MDIDINAKVLPNKEIDATAYSLTPEEAFIFSRIESPITIKRLLDISGLGKDRALELVKKLIESNILVLESLADDTFHGARQEKITAKEIIHGETSDDPFSDHAQEGEDMYSTTQEIHSAKETMSEEGSAFMDVMEDEDDMYSYDGIFSEPEQPGASNQQDVYEPGTETDTYSTGDVDSRVDANLVNDMAGTDQDSTLQEKPKDHDHPIDPIPAYSTEHLSSSEKYIYETGYKFKLGMKAKRSGDLLGAERFISAALSLTPKTSHYWWHLSMVQHDMGKYEEAEKSCISAIELEPQDVNYLKTLAKIQSALGKHGEAVKINKLVSKLEGGAPDILKELQSSAANWVNRLKDIFKK